MMGRPYGDWFGKGDTDDDVKIQIKRHGKPEKVFYDNNMAALVYPDFVVVTGYDGNEYQHCFVMKETD